MKEYSVLSDNDYRYTFKTETDASDYANRSGGIFQVREVSNWTVPPPKYERRTELSAAWHPATGLSETRLKMLDTVFDNSSIDTLKFTNGSCFNEYRLADNS